MVDIQRDSLYSEEKTWKVDVRLSLQMILFYLHIGEVGCYNGWTAGGCNDTANAESSGAVSLC